MTTGTRLVVATRNPGKLTEFRRLLAASGLALESLLDHPEAPEVAETGASYAENALLKARATASACGLAALGDDSGIEVDALDGRPGLHSARYSGGSAADNVRLLLRELRDVPDERRTARFRCVLALAWPDGRTLVAEGTCEGRIAHEPRGDAGFGYDPVFVDGETGLTFAQLGQAEKDRKSHRGIACAALRRQLG